MTPDPRYPTLQTRVPPALAERIRKAAARRNVSVSAWLRERCEVFLDGQTDKPDARTESKPPTREELRAQLDSIAAEPEGYRLPHLVQPDGSCAGGCDPDLDELCLIGPADSRRTGKRKR
jgi:hypothetical protein